jgi:hypothetical protein
MEMVMSVVAGCGSVNTRAALDGSLALSSVSACSLQVFRVFGHDLRLFLEEADKTAHRQLLPSQTEERVRIQSRPEEYVRHGSNFWVLLEWRFDESFLGSKHMKIRKIEFRF